MFVHLFAGGSPPPILVYDLADIQCFPLNSTCWASSATQIPLFLRYFLAPCIPIFFLEISKPSKIPPKNGKRTENYGVKTAPFFMVLGSTSPFIAGKIPSVPNRSAPRWVQRILLGLQPQKATGHAGVGGAAHGTAAGGDVQTSVRCLGEVAGAGYMGWF